MKSIDIKKLYLIHRWVGLVTGILLFVIAFTGALAVFGRPELKIWANPEIRSSVVVSPEDIEKVINEHAGQIPKQFHEEILVFMPRAAGYKNLTILFEDHEAGEGILLKFDNQTLEVVDKKQGSLSEVFAGRNIDVADFIVDFHADLHLGRPVGLLTTGILGLTLLASIITGFIIHRQKLKQLFTFRVKKPLDIKLADSHKLFGIWGLIFHGVISFTGAFLGLATVLLIPAAAFVSFEGDQEKLVETFTTAPQPVISGVHAPTQLAKAIDHANHYEDDLQITLFTIYNYNDQNSVIYANAIGSEKVARQLISYDGSTGEFKESFGQFGKVGGVTSKILDLMFPLHFGNFGGVFVKFIWTLLGLSTAFLPLSGLMLWLERAKKSSASGVSEATYQRFNRFVIGSCGGIVLACAALFPLQLLIHAFAVTSPNPVIFTGFFAVWSLAIILSFVVREAFAAKSIGYAIGACLLACVPLNMFSGNGSLVTMFTYQQWTAGFIELTLCALGVLSIYLTRKLSSASNQAPIANLESAEEQGA